MSATIFKVSNINQGALFVMPKPSSDDLQQDINDFRQLGVSSVLSLLQTEEQIELGLSSQQSTCKQQGIEYLSFPIQDRGYPQLKELKQFLSPLIKQVENGTKIAVHCKGGIGRTGIVSCCLLIEHGYSAKEAIELVSNARGRSVPDTDEQKAFVFEYEKAYGRL